MAHQGLAHVAGITLDYLDVVDPHTFWPVHGEEFLGEGLLIVAARVGGVRLLDNQLVHFGQ
jgi:pantothenate synthetase